MDSPVVKGLSKPILLGHLLLHTPRLKFDTLNAGCGNRKTLITVSLFQTVYIGLEVTSKTTETVRIPANRIGATKRQVSCQYHPEKKQNESFFCLNYANYYGQVVQSL